MNHGGEIKVIEKINRLESYLSEGLPGYQDVLEQQNKQMPEALKGIEYKSPGIMESQIFTVLTKRFKSGRLSFSKFGATCLAKICALRVQEMLVKIEKIEKEIMIDNSIEECVLKVKKALIKLTKNEDENNKYNDICIDSKSLIYQALKLTPISELEYII